MCSDGIAIYDAIDTARSRPVRVHVHPTGVPPRERGANVLDVAARVGLVFVVQSDDARASPARPAAPPSTRERAIPPPLPVLDIPILEDDDEDDYERDTRPPPPPREPRSKHPARWAIAILVAGAVTGVTGWSIGKARPATPRVAIVPPQASETQSEQKPIVHDVKMPPPAVEPAPSKPKPHVRPTEDPLTL